MLPKIYLDLPKFQGDFRAMPAFINDRAGVKWVCAYPNNWRKDLPTVVATIILCDPNTGCPLAIMDGTYITSIRTGAAGSVAVKYLARKNFSKIGMIGAGTQAETQLLGITEVFHGTRELKVFDQFRDKSLKFPREFKKTFSINIRPVETIKEAAEADIVVTTTPSRDPIVKKKYIKPGTHINAIGSDAKGKQ